MSSLGIDFIRKRRSDDESSDSDSEDDAPPPMKRLRNCKGDANLKHFIANKCLGLLQWIADLPLKNYVKDAMLSTTLSQQKAIEVIDLEVEKNEADVIDLSDSEENRIDLDINIEDDDDDEYSIELDKPVVLDTTTNSTHQTMLPLTSSTPFYNDRKISNSLTRKPVNGYHSKTYKKVRSHPKPAKSVPHFSPITNPATDVEMILDSPAKESDELEIVSEISTVKPKNLPSKNFSRKTLPSVTYKIDHHPKEYCVNTGNGVVNGKPAPSTERKHLSSSKTYTAHEVVRLQEKAQYQLLLDKIVSSSIYRPVHRKKSEPLQVDLTQDDDEGDYEDIIEYRTFKTESLQQPVNEFLQKYYRPCQLKSPIATEKNFLDKKKNDEDLEILEVKLPEYKPKVKKSSGFLSSDWINELKMTINAETEQRLQIVAQQEQKIERYRKRRDAKILSAQHFRGLSISEPSPVTEEYPEITPEMDRIIESVFAPGEPDEKLAVFDRCECNRMDMLTLAGLNWLNDSIINFYLELIKDRSKKIDNYPSVYCFNSYFYSSLKTRGEMSVMRWTRREDIFKYDILLVPLHLGMHWALCVIDNRSKKIKYYDSMKGPDDQCLRILQNYLVVEMREKKKVSMDPNTYSLEMVQDIPQQMNGSDCGMFTLKYADYLSRDVPITFSQENMKYFRRRMVLEILEKKLF